MARRQSTAESLSERAEQAIEQIGSGGDTLAAWEAIWDLVQQGDAQDRQRLIDSLRAKQANLPPAAVEQTRPYVAAVENSLRSSTRGALLPSAEVRRQGQRDQIEASRRAMQKMGVRPGDGMPMWALYMTRRSKRSFGG